MLKFTRISVIIAALFFAGLLSLFGCENNKKYFNTQNSFLVPRYETSDIHINGEVIAQNVAPAIVGILSTSNAHESIGAGVCVYSGGYILTNSHVTTKAKNIKIVLSDGTKGTAIKLWEDVNLDVAILKSDISIPFLPLGNVNNLFVGEEVLAVGTPLNFALNHSFTKGIVSAKNRTLMSAGDNGSIILHNLIQHDASLNPGNSGGPLINRFGEVVGINTLKMSGESMGFAIPINNLQTILEKISTDITFKTPNIGVACYDSVLESIKQNINLPEGVYVNGVRENSVAKLKGITEGCVITKINNTSIDNVITLKEELYKNYNRNVVVQYEKNGREYRCVLNLANSSLIENS